MYKEDAIDDEDFDFLDGGVEIDEDIYESNYSEIKNEYKGNDAITVKDDDINSERQSSLRSELSKFLEDTKKKKSSDGKPLLFFPNNFDQVVEAMDRNDLNSTDSNSWCSTLLSNRFDEEIRSYSFEGGRYKNIFATEVGKMSVSKGLAEIQMLDRQLKVVSDKEDAIFATMGDTKHHYNSSRGSKLAKQTANAIGSQDFTFLTRERVDSRSSSSHSSEPSSPLSSSREDEEEEEGDGTSYRSSSLPSPPLKADTSVLSFRKDLKDAPSSISVPARKGATATAIAVNAIHCHAHVNVNVHARKSSSSSSSSANTAKESKQKSTIGKPSSSDPTTASGKGEAPSIPTSTSAAAKVPPKDFLADNKLAVKGPKVSKLTFQQEARVNDLLEILPDDVPAATDDADSKGGGEGQTDTEKEKAAAAWKELARYGLSASDASRLEEIDVQLRLFELQRGVGVGGDVASGMTLMEDEVLLTHESDGSAAALPLLRGDDGKTETTGTTSGNTLLKLRVQRCREVYLLQLEKAISMQQKQDLDISGLIDPVPPCSATGSSSPAMPPPPPAESHRSDSTPRSSSTGSTGGQGFGRRITTKEIKELVNQLMKDQESKPSLHDQTTASSPSTPVSTATGATGPLTFSPPAVSKEAINEEIQKLWKEIAKLGELRKQATKEREEILSLKRLDDKSSSRGNSQRAGEVADIRGGPYSGGGAESSASQRRRRGRRSDSRNSGSNNSNIGGTGAGTASEYSSEDTAATGKLPADVTGGEVVPVRGPSVTYEKMLSDYKELLVTVTDEALDMDTTINVDYSKTSASRSTPSAKTKPKRMRLQGQEEGRGRGSAGYNSQTSDTNTNTNTAEELKSSPLKSDVISTRKTDNRIVGIDTRFTGSRDRDSSSSLAVAAAAAGGANKLPRRPSPYLQDNNSSRRRQLGSSSTEDDAITESDFLPADKDPFLSGTTTSPRSLFLDALPSSNSSNGNVLGTSRTAVSRTPGPPPTIDAFQSELMKMLNRAQEVVEDYDFEYADIPRSSINSKSSNSQITVDTETALLSRKYEGAAKRDGAVVV